MEILPPPIREYLAQDGLANTARAITSKYKLHVDQGAVVRRELMLVLTGTEAPAELAQSLQEELGLAPEILKAILEDINKDVFQPLQAKMRAATAAAPQDTSMRQVPQVPTHIAKQIPPPSNLPGAENAVVRQQKEVSQYQTPPATPETRPPFETPPLPRPIVKEYAEDPYHEPIDQH